MTALRLPHFGDVVVHRLHSATGTPYGVSTYDGPIQFAALSQKSARALADQFARLNGLDVWVTKTTTGYLSVARFRP